MSKRSSPKTQTQSNVLTKPNAKTKKPSMYRVILLNDDFTPMEFVVAVLQSVFEKDKTAATEIMLQIHQTGIGVCGIFTFEVAETKANQVMEMAKRSLHPLHCQVEKV